MNIGNTILSLLRGHDRRILADLQPGQLEKLRPRAKAIVTAVSHQSTTERARPMPMYRILTLLVQAFRSEIYLDRFTRCSVRAFPAIGVPISGSNSEEPNELGRRSLSLSVVLCCCDCGAITLTEILANVNDSLSGSLNVDDPASFDANTGSMPTLERSG